MKIIKSIFTEIYPIFAALASLAIIYFQSVNGITLGWMGILLTTVPLMIATGYTFVFQNNTRPSRYLSLLISFAILGFGLTSIEYFQDPKDNLVTLTFVFLGLSNLIIYSHWRCPTKKDSEQTTNIETCIAE